MSTLLNRYGFLFFYASLIFSSNISYAQRFPADVSETATDRTIAYDNAVYSAAQKAMGNIVGDVIWDTKFQSCLKSWVGEQKTRNYDDLVKDSFFDIDAALDRGWTVEGEITLELGVLRNWYSNQSCYQVENRGSVYIAATNGANDLGSHLPSFINAIKTTLGQQGYRVVNEARKNSAQYHILLNQAVAEARGRVKALTISGHFLDNYCGQQAILTFNATAQQRQLTTATETNAQLYELTANDLSKQLSDGLSNNTNTDTQLLFISDKQYSRSDLTKLQNQIGSELSLPSRFNQDTNVINQSQLNTGRFEIVALISSDYNTELTPSKLENLQSVAERTLGFSIIDTKTSEALACLAIHDQDRSTLASTSSSSRTPTPSNPQPTNPAPSIPAPNSQPNPNDSQLLARGRQVLQGKFHAIIIQNQQYENYYPITNAKLDAETLRSVLINDYRFDANNVHFWGNRSKATIEAQLNQIGRSLGANDSLLIFYSGHAANDDQGNAYWIPIDGKSNLQPNFANSWVNINDVLTALKTANAAQVLLINDALAGNKAVETVLPPLAINANNDYFAKQAGAGARRILSTTATGPMTVNSSSGYSLLTQRLLATLTSTSAPYISGEQLYETISGSNDLNLQAYDFSGGELNGSFVFVKR